VGLAELLSTLLTFIREEMGLRSPAASDDDEGEEEEEDGDMGFDDEEVEEEEDEGIAAEEEEELQRRPHQSPPSATGAAVAASVLPPIPAAAITVDQLSTLLLRKPPREPAVETDAATQALSNASSSPSSSSCSLSSGFSSASCEAGAERWGENMALIREALQCLGVFLRAHARKMPSAALDRAEMDHLRDAVGEIIAAYPPAALKVRVEPGGGGGGGGGGGKSSSDNGGGCVACDGPHQVGAHPLYVPHPQHEVSPTRHKITTPTPPPPPPPQITDIVLRAWPFGQSTREVGFLQLLGGVLASAPLLSHIDDRTRLPLRAFARVAACLRSPHAGVAEEALLACSNPRLISLYVGKGAPGAGPTGAEVPGMVREALAQNARGHWNADVREESGRLLEVLVAVMPVGGGGGLLRGGDSALVGAGAGPAAAETVMV
jgi:hypothetical protein